MTTALFTLGHSTRSLDEFLTLLTENRVGRIIDVRRLPGSRKHPHFDQDALAAALDSAGIGYAWAEDLTGRRPVSRTVPFETNAWWQNRSFHNYADHALSDSFRTAVDGLLAQADSRPALLCAEAVWWRCHRRIIADHLLARGTDVHHILGEGHVEAARLSDGAVVDDDAQVTYPAETVPVAD